MKSTTSTVTSKGQILIPAWLRNKLGIKAGMRVNFTEKGKDLIVHPQTPDYFDQFVGILGKDRKMLDILLEERRKDALKEDKKARGKIRS